MAWWGALAGAAQNSSQTTNTTDYGGGIGGTAVGAVMAPFEGVRTGNFATAAKRFIDPAGIFFKDPIDPLAGLSPALRGQITGPINTGAFSGNQFSPYAAQAQQYAAQIASRPGFMAGNDGQFRNQQQQLGNVLMQRIMGNSMSPAELQFRQAQEDNARQIMAAGASQRGVGNAGLQARNLSEALATSNLATAGKAAEIRSAEQLAAENSMGALLNQGRTGDISQAHQGTLLEQVRGNLIADALGRGLDATAAQVEAQQRLEELISRERQNFLSANTASQGANRQREDNIMGGAVDMFGKYWAGRQARGGEAGAASGASNVNLGGRVDGTVRL